VAVEVATLQRRARVTVTMIPMSFHHVIMDLPMKEYGTMDTSDAVCTA
jgi:hypothetical protein